MSSAEPAPPAAEAELPPDDAARCAQCGAALDGDQEWCLECGAARTLIHRPPDWRLPAALVTGVVLLILAGLTIALIGLSNSANREDPTASRARAATATPAPTAAPPSTAAPATSPAAGAQNATAPSASTGTSAAPASTAAATAPPPTAGTASATETTASAPGLASWPIGLSGWTVVLASAPTEDRVRFKAAKLTARGLTDLGLIETSQHPAMKTGRWVIFFGRYPTGEAAGLDAGNLRSRGFIHAHPELVGQAGG